MKRALCNGLKSNRLLYNGLEPLDNKRLMYTITADFENKSVEHKNVV